MEDGLERRSFMLGANYYYLDVMRPSSLGNWVSRACVRCVYSRERDQCRRLDYPQEMIMPTVQRLGRVNPMPAAWRKPLTYFHIYLSIIPRCYCIVLTPCRPLYYTTNPSTSPLSQSCSCFSTSSAFMNILMSTNRLN